MFSFLFESAYNLHYNVHDDNGMSLTRGFPVTLYSVTSHYLWYDR